MNYETIILLTTHETGGTPHINQLIENNPGVPIHILSGKKLDESERSIAWRNCDRMLREWWMGHGQFLSFNHVLVLEYDVLFSASIDSIFPKKGHFTAKLVKYPHKENDNWIWFNEISKLPAELQKYACGIVPLAAMLISKKCLEGIMNHPLAEEVFEQDIFCELRLATLAVAAGFKPKSNLKRLINLRAISQRPSLELGVWHAIKNSIW